MQICMGRLNWRQAVCSAAVVAALFVAGCGESQTPPPTAPGAPKAGDASKTMPAGTAAPMNMSGGGGDVMSGPPKAGAIAEGDTKAVTSVYYCSMDKLFETAAGDCPKCKMALKEMKLANPDPAVCVVTGEKIVKHNSFAIVNDKAYAFCCGMCLDELVKDTDGVVKKAQERADKAKGQK